ncbi:hypothetical protein FNV62_18260 [Streptomyces sp. RLB3-17]|nr:hypothetical protein FNV62_18260 [Streptomyces sp. RLB3-17]
MNPGTWASVERGRCPQGGLPGLARARAEAFDFWNPGCQEPFAEWLWKRLGRHSSLGWAAEIEREAEASNTPAVELFFSLLDEYRAERGQPKG